MKVLRILALLVSVGAMGLSLPGCGVPSRRVGIAPPGGVLYTRQRAPSYCPCWKEGGVTHTPNLKVGKASASKLGVPNLQRLSILGVRQPQPLSFGWGDMSLEAATRNGGITKIHYADHEILEILPVLGLYTKATLIVYGE